VWKLTSFDLSNWIAFLKVAGVFNCSLIPNVLLLQVKSSVSQQSLIAVQNLRKSTSDFIGGGLWIIGSVGSVVSIL